ncbi:hypothetical protein [Paenibacillus sp. A3]|uniref:hypothetical protein n=1 Tax=Paenibacillus sp. A3 TaxID=1337054 RepID=UPI000A955361|nr:hypothetical protein [Paenibacillus sp. A3]
MVSQVGGPPFDTNYSLKTVQFDVASIDFTKKAVLVVQNKEEKTTYKYDIDFKKYVR